MKITTPFIILFISLFLWSSAVLAGDNKNDVIILCYHDIPKEVKLDDYGVDQKSFVQQIEYLRTHGYHFISLDELIEASKGKRAIPEKAVLLTFDDAYLSFYEFVYPLLELYKYPSVVAVETSLINPKTPLINWKPLMNWKQLKTITANKLVTIVSHTHDLHHGVLYNPQGNTGHAAVSRIYNPDTATYESKDDYRQRVRKGLALSKNLLKEKVGIDARAIVWPYGSYNQICVEEAAKLGFEAMFYLGDKVANTEDTLYAIPRYIFVGNPTIIDFIKELKNNFKQPIKQRVLQVDLDLIYDTDSVQQNKNLDMFIERVFSMKITTVYLQAFCDKKGDGNISSVYFPNRVLPMRADLFNRVVNQLSIRDIQVYAWMPMLSIALPDKKKTAALRVREFKDGKIRPSTSWYPRLSPFSQEVSQKLVMLYEDMAANARIDGVVFLDDGYLNDFEDFHPDALTEYYKISNNKNIPFEQLNPEQKTKWVNLKTKKLIELTDQLKKAVLYYKPLSYFARTLYASVLTEPKSEEWFAQNYRDSLKAYDYVVIMAYPMMEKQRRPVRWLEKIVQEVKKYPKGLQKTVFKVQAYDWEKKAWIDAETVTLWLKKLIASGAWHVGYYPDNYVQNQPDKDTIRTIMSTEDFGFKRKYTAKDITLAK